LKWLLRRKLKQIHQQLKLSLIYVTHDQIEALTFADTVVVMTQGEIVQSGTAQELFETPEHTFVGHFIGNPGMNFLPCELQSDSGIVAGQAIPLDSSLVARARNHAGPYKLGIRPEFIECLATEQSNAQPVAIKSIQPLGTHTMIAAEIGKHPLWIKVRDDARFASDTAWIRMRPEHTLLYANEKRVR
jgi:glycerol transport system ATP-binding protein